jgi:hypothetical protein
MITTSQQDAAAELAASEYGCSAVVPSHLHEFTGCVVVIGLSDDVERSSWTIRRDGAVANVAWFDSALELYLSRIEPQRRPLLVPRPVQTGGLAVAGS